MRGGGFLVPGLWDMHVHLGHLGEKEELPLYIANGVSQCGPCRDVTWVLDPV